MLFLSTNGSRQELCRDKTVVQIFGIRAVVICKYGTGSALKMQVKSTIGPTTAVSLCKDERKKALFLPLLA